MSNLVELFCHAGQHSWLRPSQRGRRPFNCPEHDSAGISLSASPRPEPSEQASEPVEKPKRAKAAPKVPETLQAYLTMKTFVDERSRKLAYIARQIASGQREDDDIKILKNEADHILKAMR